MNETSRKPITWTRHPTLFDKWMGSVICPVTETRQQDLSHGPVGESKCSAMRQIRTADLSVHDDRPKTEDKRIPPVLKEEDLLHDRGMSAITAPPRVGHPRVCRAKWLSTKCGTLELVGQYRSSMAHA